MRRQPIQRLYGSLYLTWVQLLPEECDSRVMKMAFLRMGLLGSGSVQTGRLAAYMPIAIKKLRIVRRMERFLDNGAMRVRAWSEPIASQLLEAARVAGKSTLVVDSTKVSAHHRLVLVGLA